MATPIAIDHLEAVDSTQDEARNRYDGTPRLVTAGEQTRGRGRSGAKWLDADRSLAASVAFEPGWAPGTEPRLALVAGLAITDLLPDSVRLAWPNDLVVGHLKVGGILSESAGGLVVVGLGLNVHWADPPPGMGALHGTDPGPQHARRVAERWAGTLLERAAGGPDEWGRAEYVDRCATVGCEVTWEPGGSGSAEGVSDDGALLVRVNEGVVELHSGAVRRVRSA